LNGPASSESETCPLTRVQVLDRYFLEHRAALLDLAAFLDRLDRARPDAYQGATYRETAIQGAIDILSDGHGERAKRIQQILSDSSDEPAESASDTAATNGA